MRRGAATRFRPAPPAGAAICLASLAFGAAPGAAGQAERQQAELNDRFGQARAAAVHLLAPRAFEEALDQFEDAVRRRERGRADERYRELLSEAGRRLESAERVADAARPVFDEALAAREEALRAEAESRTPQSWERAEDELVAAGRRFESGDPAAAAERAGRAAELYRRSAAAGWRDIFLGEAVQARAAAVAAGAFEAAPATFARGENLLAEGEERLEANRSDDNAAGTGDAAAATFDRASRIAALLDSVRRRDVSLERLFDEHEANLALLAESAGAAPARHDVAGTTERIAAAIEELLASNGRLDEAVQGGEARISELESNVATLQRRLSESQRQFAEVRDELLDLRAGNDRLREVWGLFAPEEGNVYLSGNQLILSLFGFTFQSGEADLSPDSYPLLIKVQRVIETFEGVTVRIEGHTDSDGADEANRVLSQERAIAVREQLLARVPIPSSRIEAVGFGEERPVATNETEAGRARNRRIEVRITLPGA